MSMTVTSGNTQSVATLFAIDEKVSQHKMSSREIAELTGKRHDNVKRTIDSLVVDRIIAFPQIEENPASLGRPGRHYLIGKRDSFVVVAQLSPQFTAALVDRWQALESTLIGRIQVPTSFSEALRLAADQAEQNQQLQQVIQQQAPKVQALERLAGTHGSVCITTAAKQLGVGPLKLFKWLSDNRWIYRRAAFSSWSAYQPRLTAGLLEHKLVTVGKGAEEDLKVVEQVMVTRKGITTLAEQLQGNSL